MSTTSNIIITALLLARVAEAEPEQASLPWQLHSMVGANVVQADTAASAFRDPQGNIDIAETTALSATYQITDRWAPTIRLAFAGNNAPGSALDGASFGNPVAGMTYTRSRNSRRLVLFGALAIPVGTGGGNEPDTRAARTNAASITARPADEAMFEVDYATAIAGADVAYVNHGLTAQVEATLEQSVRVRGASTAAGADALRTRASLGAHVGVFLGRHASVGADLDYRRSLTASIGARVHFHVGKASIRPGLSYTRGLDGFALHGPMTITKETNTVAISIPAEF